MEENKLVEMAKTDEVAFETLLQNYKVLVSKIARSYYIVGGEMDDLVQEGMIGLYKAINSYDAQKQASFKTFATLCIKRQIQTAIKKAMSNKSKMFHSLIDNETISFLNIGSNKENPEKNYISQENYNIITDEIKNTLSKLEKKVLLQYLEGYTYDQIAENLNMNKKSVDNALNRIRNKLSHFLSDINF